MSKRKLVQLFCSVFVLFFSLLAASISIASPSPSQFDPLITANSPGNPPISDAVEITNSHFGWAGPLSFGVTYDSLDKYYGKVKYTQKISEHFAVSGLLDYGDNLYRYGATLGLKFVNDLLKFSVERLSEVLPFEFDSGKINHRIGQNAYGARYQHAFENQSIQNIGLGVYYSHAPSEWLAPVTELNTINLRRIAGGTSKGMDLSSDVKLSPATVLTGRIYYDEVTYDTILNNPQTPNNNSRGLGGGVVFNQLITDTVKFSVEGNLRKVYDTYKAFVSWLPTYFSSVGMEISLVGERTVSHNSTPSSNSVGLAFSFSPEIFGSKKITYQVPSTSAFSDLNTWTNDPVVRMERVLAQAEQKTQTLPLAPASLDATTIASTLPVVTKVDPRMGDIAGGAKVIIIGHGFTGATAVVFGAISAANFTVDSDTQITAISPAHMAGKIDVRVITPKGVSMPNPPYDEYTYVPSDQRPTITGISPNHGTGSEPITITGTNFTGTTGVKVGTIPLIPHRQFVVHSDTKITAIIPSGGHGKVTLQVTTPKGTNAPNSPHDQYTYDPRGDSR